MISSCTLHCPKTPISVNSHSPFTLGISICAGAAQEIATTTTTTTTKRQKTKNNNNNNNNKCYQGYGEIKTLIH